MKVVQIRLEGDEDTVAYVKARLAGVFDLDGGRTKRRRDRVSGEEFVHCYLHAAVDPAAT